MKKILAKRYFNCRKKFQDDDDEEDDNDDDDEDDATRSPDVLIEFPTPTSVLVREMSSGMPKKKKLEDSKKLLEEATRRTYCNGKKFVFAATTECGAAEWMILTAVGPITIGSGDFPAAEVAAEVGNGAAGSEMGELMYMRGRFERVTGSHGSES